MATTNNVPSDNFEDLLSDVRSITKYMNGDQQFQTRTGRQITPLPAQQSMVENLIRNSGFQPVGNFATGATITAVNQVLFNNADSCYYNWQGAVPFTVPAGTNPTANAGPAAWVNRGNIRNHVTSVSCLKDLAGITPVDGQQFSVAGFYADSSIGGGVFVYDENKVKHEHDGGSIIAPESLDIWDGQESGLNLLFDWDGEGHGAYVKKYYSELSLFDFGAIRGHDVYSSFKAMAKIGYVKVPIGSFDVNATEKTSIFGDFEIFGAHRNKSKLNANSVFGLVINDGSFLMTKLSVNKSDGVLIDLDYLKNDIESVCVSDCKLSNAFRFIHGSTEKPHNFSVGCISVTSNRFRNVLDAAVHVAAVKVEKWIVRKNILNGSQRSGFLCGYADEYGAGLLQDDLGDIEISSNRIMNINHPGTVPHAGSNAVYATGLGVAIEKNSFINCFNSNGVVQSNQETVYIKSIHSKIKSNTFLDCAGNQGVVTVKGGTKFGSTIPNSYDHVVLGNSFRNKSVSVPFSQSVGIFIQSEDVYIDKNSFRGFSYKIIEVNANSIPLCNINISNISAYECSCFIYIDIVGALNNLSISNVYIDKHTSTSRRHIVRLATTATGGIEDSVLEMIRVGKTQYGNGKLNLVLFSGVNDIERVSISKCGGWFLDRVIQKDGDCSVIGLDIYKCFFPNVQVNSWLNISGGKIIDLNTDSMGFLLHKGTMNLGSPAPKSSGYSFYSLNWLQPSMGISCSDDIPTYFIAGYKCTFGGFVISYLNTHTSISPDLTNINVDLKFSYINKTVEV